MLKILLIAPLMILLGTASLAQDRDPLHAIAEEGEAGRAVFQHFFTQFIEPRKSATRQQTLDAAYGLTKYLNSKGLYSTVVATERHPDWVRVRILPKRDWKRSLPKPAHGVLSAHPWLRLAEAGQEPVPHLLCQMADDRFWNCEVSADFFYYFDHAVDPNTHPRQGEYIWDGEYHHHRQMVILPAHFFSAPLDRLVQQPGLIFGLVQHDGHNKRVTHQPSLFHARVNGKELARIPAFQAAAASTLESLRNLYAAETAVDGASLKASLDDFQHFAVQGLNEADAALTTVQRIDDAFQKSEIGPIFDSNLDNTFYAALTLDNVQARFYIVSIEPKRLEGKPDALLSTALATQIADTRHGLSNAVLVLGQWASLARVLGSDTLTRTQKLNHLKDFPAQPLLR